MPDQTEAKNVAVAASEPFKGSGKELGLVKPPIVSLSPTTTVNHSVNAEDNKPMIIEDADDFLMDKHLEANYPFANLKVGQGMFIKNLPGKTTDQMVEKYYTDTYNARSQYSEIERNETGDEIYDMVIEKTRKRNDDGSIQLNNGVPNVGANQTIKPKYSSYRNFVVKGVAKDTEVGNSKVPEDGVLIIRVL